MDVQAWALAVPCLRRCGGGEKVIRQGVTPRVLYRKSRGFGINLMLGCFRLLLLAEKAGLYKGC